MPGSRVIEELGRVYPARVRPAAPWEAKQAADDYGRPAEPDWRDIDWSPHVHTTHLLDREVTYADIGSGEDPPVVLVHGLGGNWQNWLEQMPRVAETRRAVALDLPGFGCSEMPAEDISISGYARVVDALCEELGLGPVVVVGNSMGGFIGAELAISYPSRVERLVLVSAAGLSSTNLHRRPTVTVARYTTVLGTLTATKSRTIVTRRRLRHMVLAPVVRHPSRLPADLLYEVLLGTGKPGYVNALDALMTYDFRDRLPEIACPALIIWGRQDMLVPVRDADEYERLIPDSRKVLLEETGHAPMIERPDTLNRCLMTFIEEDEPSGS